MQPQKTQKTRPLLVLTYIYTNIYIYIHIEKAASWAPAPARAKAVVGTQPGSVAAGAQSGWWMAGYRFNVCCFLCADHIIHEILVEWHLASKKPLREWKHVYLLYFFRYLKQLQQIYKILLSV